MTTKKLVFLFLGMGFTSLCSYAQIGVSNTTPDPSAVLDLSAANKGFLPPRVALTSLTAASPLTNPATGRMVYNTATMAGLTPGYYYNSGSSGSPVWVRFGDLEKPMTAENLDLLSFDGTNWVAKRAVITNTGNNQAVNNMPPYLVLNYCIALVGIYPSRNSSEPFLGEIELYGFDFAPRGFASCNGAMLSISSNTALYSLLGTIYGGDGRTTFGLPDLRGRVPINQGWGAGLSSRPIGQRSGQETNTLTISNLPSHTHAIIYQ